MGELVHQMRAQVRQLAVVGGGCQLSAILGNCANCGAEFSFTGWTEN